MVEKQHRWSLSWDSTGMLSGAFQAFHFNRFIAPRTLFSFFLSSDRCKRSWFRAHNCHFRVRVLFQVVLPWVLVPTYHISWPFLDRFSAFVHMKSIGKPFDVDFINHWCMNIARSLTIGPKAQARKFPLFLSPDSSPHLPHNCVSNCSSGWWHCSFFTQEPFTTSTENMVLWQEICRLIQPRRII